MRLGIMGGTFDPIHNGHLLIAQEAGWRLELDRVLFIPTGNPPHKQNHEIASDEHRCRMVQLAIADNPLFELSTIELERQGFSYTVDTLEALHARYGPGTDFYFITGADAAADLLTWHLPQRILELAHLVVAERPGYQLPVAKLQAGLPGINLAKRLVMLDVPMVEVSSHELRERIARCIPVKYLLPDEVMAYIVQEKLYQGDNYRC
ncbi:MAG TPA: nicotinate-nucleotide adenylyltransferase [Chloroflexia bacterium]|nr:nicotinate-nucleotide adenylyltransferase [Chloroflexia bacterium]